MVGKIPKRRQLEVWLRQNSGTKPVSLRQYLRATEARIGWKLGFCQLFIHNRLGGDQGVLKTKLRSAAREVARRGGVVGDFWWVERPQAVEATLVLADESLARLIILKEEKMFDIGKFVWGYTNCPEEFEDGTPIPVDEVVPDFFGNGYFNTVHFGLKTEVDTGDPTLMLPGEERGFSLTPHPSMAVSVGRVDDTFGWWELLPIDQIDSFSYESCSGSVIEARRNASGEWEVVRTENVGATTCYRLRAAGHMGPVNRKPFITLVCRKGHQREEDGEEPRLELYPWCEKCGDETAFAPTQEEAELLWKAHHWVFNNREGATAHLTDGLGNPVTWTIKIEDGRYTAVTGKMRDWADREVVNAPTLRELISPIFGQGELTPISSSPSHTFFNSW